MFLKSIHLYIKCAGHRNKQQAGYFPLAAVNNFAMQEINFPSGSRRSTSQLAVGDQFPDWQQETTSQCRKATKSTNYL